MSMNELETNKSQAHKASNALRFFGLSALLIAFLYQFRIELHNVGGDFDARTIGILVNHGQAASEIAASALGASTGISVILIVISSLFKTLRNGRTRWKILILGCFLSTIATLASQISK